MHSSKLHSLKAPKSVTTLQLNSTYLKNDSQRMRLLKQLEQLGLNLAEYEHLSLKELMAKTEYIMNNTYSIKYLGLNKNEMGIISRRINPLTDQELKIHQNVADTFSVHKYFYPKPLKTGKKALTTKQINVQNLESQIKKEFEENKVEEARRFKENKDEKLRTKMMGSWFSVSNDRKSTSRSGGLDFNGVAESLVPKMNETHSFSRFLGKGILVVRD